MNVGCNQKTRHKRVGSTFSLFTKSGPTIVKQFQEYLHFLILFFVPRGDHSLGTASNWAVPRRDIYIKRERESQRERERERERPMLC